MEEELTEATAWQRLQDAWTQVEAASDELTRHRAWRGWERTKNELTRQPGGLQLVDRFVRGEIGGRP